MKFQFRHAKKGEERQIQKFFGDQYFLHLDTASMMIQKKDFLVAATEEKIIGIININRKRNKIAMVVVDKEWRRLGIGVQLVLMAKAVYKMRVITLSAVKESIPFWISLGFQPTGVKIKTKRQILTQMISG